ncbi:hypothetical protein PILCRDRAFT_17153 [Piloderma croceum F 1598]|uniref:Oxysterol-binding protein n=1 Tax=Piloderma croceum (strain F 1598) TaxID=765440 RepID=A0A0C3ETD3_PILCF|nr:hypothetical protein PILCRDRAFT_17153 [Piloderma croceum F 1598]
MPAAEDCPKDDVVDIDAPGPPISVPDSSDGGEGGKLKMIIALVKKSLGVKDIAAMRLSLPASLLEPIPNLEYWHYLDRPDLFAAINDSDDPFERMLAVIRFTFTKDLKFIHGKICKPYNSVLGEHFRAHWDIIPVETPSDPNHPPILKHYTTSPACSPPIVALVNGAGPSETASVKSGKSSKSTRSGLSALSKVGKSPSTAPTSPQQTVETNVDAQMSDLSLGENDNTGSADGDSDSVARVRVVYVTEQVSHHPPVSAYYTSCPARSLEMTGIDQITAKVSGTTLRVAPGSHNKGIYINITGGPGEGEKYHITHPIASVNGILRGSFYLTVGDTTIITCTGGKSGQMLRTLIDYKEESWLGKAHFLLEGVIHTYTIGDTEHEAWTKVRHVPQSRVVAIFDGSWKHHIKWRRTGSTNSSAATSASDVTSTAETGEYSTLLDLSTLKVIPKTVRPIERQFSNESRKLWHDVTTRLIKKEYGEATKYKLAIEQKQRDEAAERKRQGVEFIPLYFEKDISSGTPTLTREGLKAVEDELGESSPHCLEGYDEPAGKSAGVGS